MSDQITTVHKTTDGKEHKTVALALAHQEKLNLVRGVGSFTCSGFSLSSSHEASPPLWWYEHNAQKIAEILMVLGVGTSDAVESAGYQERLARTEQQLELANKVIQEAQTRLTNAIEGPLLDDAGNRDEGGFCRFPDYQFIEKSVRTAHFILSGKAGITL